MDTEEFSYRAITVPFTGEHFSLAAEKATEADRWVALARRIGFRVQRRTARHKTSALQRKRTKRYFWLGQDSSTDRIPS